MIAFSKAKFSSLTKKRQHKHAARILRRIIEEDASLKCYTEIEDVFTLPPIATLEEITDRFHLHLKEAESSPAENEFLNISQKNRNSTTESTNNEFQDVLRDNRNSTTKYPKNEFLEICRGNQAFDLRQGDHASGTDFLNVDIYLDNLRSAHNVGSIIRTAEAFRLGEIYCGGNTPSHEKIQKTSMHSHKDVTIHPEASYCDLTKRPVIALETAKNATPLRDFIFPDSFSLILGNEELGVSSEGLRMSDFIVEIPLYGKKNSLNVSSAFAIVADYIRNANR